MVRAPRIGFHFLPLHILTTLSGVASIDDDAATLERFSANDVLLLPGTTYWIVVTRTGGADDGLSVATTSSEDAVDAGGMAGFSVGNNVWVPDPDYDEEWADYSGSVDASMKIGLRGSEATRPPGPYATNRNEQSRAAAAETSSSTSRYATSFTTASVPDTHQLTSVLLGVAAEAGVSPRVAIHADASGGRPAASALTNGTLTAPADVSRVLGAPERAEFTASPAISLAGGTRYWVVLDVGSGTGSLSVSTTASDLTTKIPQPQWPIGDTMKAYSGTSWSNDSQGRSFRMALNGPTDQYIGPPFEPMREVRIGLPQVGVGVAAEILDQSLKGSRTRRGSGSGARPVTGRSPTSPRRRAAPRASTCLLRRTWASGSRRWCPMRTRSARAKWYRASAVRRSSRSRSCPMRARFPTLGTFAAT